MSGAAARFRFVPGRRDGFSLIELLVALVVFAAMAAAAYGGLAQIARARAALAAQQDRFSAVTRAVSSLERDLRQAVSRPVLGNSGERLNALAGAPDSIELSHLGFANPRAERRSNVERVVYAIDDHALKRGRYAVLDRAPDSAPATRLLLDRVETLSFRYLGCDGAWRDLWPPSEWPCGTGSGLPETWLPLAVEFRFVLGDFGEIRRTIELPSAPPPTAVGAQ